MKLIGTYPSPFVRKVRIVLLEKKIDCEFVIDSPWKDGNQISHHNPLGKIPVLILDDETVVYDSRVIAEHLDAGTPNNKLIPASGRERTLVKRWEALGDGMCEAAIAMMLERKRRDGERSEGWIKRQHEKLNLALDALEAGMADTPSWLHGNSFTLADVAVGTALFYIDFRLPDITWRTDHPKLADYAARLSQRPSFAETIPND